MKKTNLPSDDIHNDPELLKKAEDTEFWIKVISSVIVMAAVVVIVIAGKFVVKKVSGHFHKEAVPIEELDPEIQMDFDTDTIITQDELNELTESLDDMVKDFAESNSQSAP